MKRGGEALALQRRMCLARRGVSYLSVCPDGAISHLRRRALVIACFQLTPVRKGVQNGASLLISDAAGLLEGPTADILRRVVVCMADPKSILLIDGSARDRRYYGSVIQGA